MRRPRPGPDARDRRRAEVSPRSTQAGFTLIEVLAAFVILALVAVVIQNGATSAVAGIAAARARVGAETVAASLASGPIAAPTGGSGETVGTLNGYDWALKLDVLQHNRFIAGPQGEPNAPWIPVQTRVTVRRSGGGPVLAILETIRLVQTIP